MPPLAEDDSYTINEDSNLDTQQQSIATLLENDSDPDVAFSELSEELRVNLVSGVTVGTLQLESDGHFAYTPPTNYFGSVSFQYSVTDKSDATATGKVHIDILPVNDIPTPLPDEYVTNEDETLMVAANIGLLSNDSDVESGGLTVNQVIIQPQNGELSVNADGGFSYTPNPNFNGGDSFEYQVVDTEGSTSNAAVQINVLAQPDHPIANNEEISLFSGNSTEIAVLANDSHPDGEALIIVSASAQQGSVQIREGTVLQYSISSDFSGTDIVYYTIAGQEHPELTASASVSISVIKPNNPPTANDDTATTFEGTAVTVNVLQNDSDPDGDGLTISQASANNGNVSIINLSALVYTPDNGFIGSDNISYSISDGHGSSDSANVTVTVEAIPKNDPPTANDEVATAYRNSVLNIDVLANDTDPDGDPLSVIDASASNGSVSINGDYTLDYTPNTDYVGPDQIDYVISDGQNHTDNASVIINVESNMAPVAVADNYNVLANGSYATIDSSVGVLANDSDPDGGTLSVTLVDGPDFSSGFTLNGTDGSFTYRHNQSSNLTDSFTYELSDGSASVTTTVTLNITLQDYHLPDVCGMPVTSVQVDKPYVYDPQAGDADGESVTYSASLPNWLSINPSTGVISGTPTAGDIGLSPPISIQMSNDNGKASINADSFQINVYDDFGNSESVSFQPGTGNQVNDMATDNYGNIVLVGKTDDNFFIQKLKPDGNPDTGFGNNGLRTIDFGHNDEALAVTVDKKNRILVAGTAFDPSNNNNFAVARLLENGSLDNSFDSDGLKTLDLAGDYDVATDILTEDSGAIVIAGYRYLNEDSDIVVIRLLSDGMADASFGDGGILVNAASGNQYLYEGISEPHSGKLYFVGKHTDGSNGDILIAAIERF